MKTVMKISQSVLFVGVLTVGTSWACVPNQSAEDPEGPRLEEAAGVTIGAGTVDGRPTTVRTAGQGMGGGGTQQLDQGTDNVDGTGGLTGGNGLEEPVTFTAGMGTVTRNSTVTENGDGSWTIEPGPGGSTVLTSGTIVQGDQGRVYNNSVPGGSGSVQVMGGVLELNSGTEVVENPNGTISFEGGDGVGGRIDTPNSVFSVGGIPVAPGVGTFSVEEGPARNDSNQSYVE